MKKEKIYSQARVVAIYDNRRFGGKSGAWVNERELNLVLRLLPKKGKILDVPSGTGRLAKYLQDRKYEVVCADVSSPMLKKTKKRVKKATKVIKASADSLPFGDEKFDAVVHLRFLFHFADIKNFLKESKRVTKKGGSVVFDTYNWSPRALPFQKTKVFIHSRKKIEKLIESLDLKLVQKIDCFLFSPLVYRVMPWILIPILSKIERVWPKFLLVRTFWQVKKVR